MQIRSHFEQHSSVVLAAAVSVIVVTGLFIVWWIWPRSAVAPHPMAYFYDLNTRELFVGPAAPGPVETGSGPYKGQMPAGVRAHVYCCGPYRQGSEKFIGYLEIPFNELPESDRPRGIKIDPEVEGAEVLIRRVDGDTWYDATSPEGQRIKQEVGDRCPPEKRLTYVTPPPQ
jgi:hypothetical protein